MKQWVKAVSIVTILGLGAGCASNVNNQDVGVVTGGVIGGLLGSQFGKGSGQVAAAVGGSMLGAYLGGQIGRTMDRQDKIEMQHALETGKTGSAVHWVNPDSGNRYTVKPTKTFYHDDRPCREYVTIAYIDGKRERVHGKACRDQSGKWQSIR